jgi:uncharacterized GH25 family protein
MRRPLHATLAATLLFAVAVPVHASSLWLQTDPVAPGPQEEVRVRLIRGDRFPGEDQPAPDDRVALFQRLRKNGRDNLPVEGAVIPAATVRAGQAGVEIIALSWKGRTGPNDGYYCKVVMVVGDATEDNPIRYSELGQRLEIVPQTDPVKLHRSGGRLEVQVLFDREPLAGTRLAAIPQAAPSEGILTAVTDEIGLARFELDRPGLWLIEAVNKTPDSRSRATLVLSAGGR